MNRVLLLDTSSLFFRAYHALPPMTTRAGEPTSAVYGLCTLILKLLREHSPRGISFALDAPVETFRHAKYTAYKAQRAPAPDALRRQFARLRELLEALGAPVFRVPGFEADDVLATLAHELSISGDQVLIVSGDRDLFQVAKDGVDILFVGRRGREPVTYDAAAVEKRFGVPPERLPSFIALVGDPSDNIVGVSGVGPRTAAKLVNRFGSIESLLELLDQVAPAPLRESLRAASPQLRLNEDIARLRVNVPLGPGARWLPVTAEAVGRLRQLFDELEFKSLLRRLEALQIRP